MPSSSLVEVEVGLRLRLRLGFGLRLGWGWLGLKIKIKFNISKVRSTNEFKSYFFGQVGGWLDIWRVKLISTQV